MIYNRPAKSLQTANKSQLVIGFYIMYMSLANERQYIMLNNNPVLHLHIHMYVYFLFAVNEIRVIFTLHRIMMPELYIWVSNPQVIQLFCSPSAKTVQIWPPGSEAVTHCALSILSSNVLLLHPVTHKAPHLFWCQHVWVHQSPSSDDDALDPISDVSSCPQWQCVKHCQGEGAGPWDHECDPGPPK